MTMFLVEANTGKRHRVTAETQFEVLRRLQGKGRIDLLITKKKPRK